MTVTKTPSAYDQQLFYLFVTAIEGGIGYWSRCSLYHNSLPDRSDDTVGFKAEIVEIDDDEHISHWPKHTIDRKVISKGYRLATSAKWRGKLGWSTGKPPFVVGPETDWDFDAGDADMIVQLGLFGDVRYG